MTPAEWENMSRVAHGSFESALDRLKQTLLALKPHERFAVYADYGLEPSTAETLPEPDLPEPGSGRWVVHDRHGVERGMGDWPGGREHGDRSGEVGQRLREVRLDRRPRHRAGASPARVGPAATATCSGSSPVCRTPTPCRERAPSTRRPARPAAYVGRDGAAGQTGPRPRARRRRTGPRRPSRVVAPRRAAPGSGRASRARRPGAGPAGRRTAPARRRTSVDRPTRRRSRPR